MNSLRNELIENIREENLEEIHIKKRINKSKTLSEFFNENSDNIQIRSLNNNLNNNCSRNYKEEKPFKYKTKIDKINKKIEKETLNLENRFLKKYSGGFLVS